MSKKQMQYVKNDSLPVIKPEWKGNPKIGKRFQSYDGKGFVFLRDVIKWKLFSSNPQRKAKKQDVSPVKVIPFDVNLREEKDFFVWFGHASFYYQLQGVKIMTDPCFFNIPLYKRKIGLPCAVDTLYVDIIVISHDHLDHFCRRSIDALLKTNPNLKIILPLGGSERLKQDKYPVVEMGWFQRLDVQDLSIYFLPAKHWSRSNMTNFNATLWGSFMIESQNRFVYFSGDTGFSEHFKDIADLFPKIDYAFMGIGAYSPYWFMSKSHINPEDALRAARVLHSPVVVPMHYGAYELSDEPISEPIGLFINEAKGQGMQYLNPMVGDVFFF